MLTRVCWGSGLLSTETESKWRHLFLLRWPPETSPDYVHCAAAGGYHPTGEWHHDSQTPPSTCLGTCRLYILYVYINRIEILFAYFCFSPVSISPLCPPLLAVFFSQAVCLESAYPHVTRYMVVVSTNGRQDTEESIVLGMDFSSSDRSVSLQGRPLHLSVRFVTLIKLHTCDKKQWLVVHPYLSFAVVCKWTAWKKRFLSRCKDK